MMQLAHWIGVLGRQGTEPDPIWSIESMLKKHEARSKMTVCA